MCLKRHLILTSVHSSPAALMASPPVSNLPPPPPRASACLKENTKTGKKDRLMLINYRPFLTSPSPIPDCSGCAARHLFCFFFHVKFMPMSRKHQLFRENCCQTKRILHGSLGFKPPDPRRTTRAQSGRIRR